jgi:hypothetical protein
MKHARIDPEQGSLVCPECSGDYMHAARVVVHSRAEDSLTSTVTSVGAARVLPYDGSVATASAPPEINYSSRRTCINIVFMCEGCGFEPRTLSLVQHKGVTYMEWHYDA